MIVGRNILRLNHATIKLAVEEYLNHRTSGPGDEITVSDVSYTSGNGGGYWFDTTVEPKAKTETP